MIDMVQWHPLLMSIYISTARTLLHPISASSGHLERTVTTIKYLKAFGAVAKVILSNRRLNNMVYKACSAEGTRVAKQLLP